MIYIRYKSNGSKIRSKKSDVQQEYMEQGDDSTNQNETKIAEFQEI